MAEIKDKNRQNKQDELIGRLLSQPVEISDIWKTSVIEGYAYIEKVSLPASFSILITSSSMFNWENIGCAIADIVIYPPSTTGIVSEKEVNLLKDLLNIIQLNPVIVLTERYATENPYSNFYLENKKEIIRFIGVAIDVVSDSVINARGGNSIQVRIKAIDLLNYALHTTKIYNLGNTLNLSAAGAYGITPQQIIQAIYTSALEAVDKNKYLSTSDLISYLLSLIGTYASIKSEQIVEQTQQVSQETVQEQDQQQQEEQQESENIDFNCVNREALLDKIQQYLFCRDMLELKEVMDNIVREFSSIHYFVPIANNVNTKVPSSIIRNVYRLYWGLRDDVKEIKKDFEEEINKYVQDVSNVIFSFLGEINTSDYSLRGAYKSLQIIDKIPSLASINRTLYAALLYSEADDLDKALNRQGFEKIDPQGAIGPFQITLPLFADKIANNISEDDSNKKIKDLKDKLEAIHKNYKELKEKVKNIDNACLLAYIYSENYEKTIKDYGLSCRDKIDNINKNLVSKIRKDSEKLISMIIEDKDEFEAFKNAYFRTVVEIVDEKAKVATELAESKEFDNKIRQMLQDIPRRNETIDEMIKKILEDPKLYNEFKENYALLEAYRGVSVQKSGKGEKLVGFREEIDKTRLEKLLYVFSVSPDKALGEEYSARLVDLFNKLRELSILTNIDEQVIVNYIIEKIKQQTSDLINKIRDFVVQENRVNVTTDKLKDINDFLREGKSITYTQIAEEGDDITAAGNTIGRTLNIPALQFSVTDFWDKSGLRNLVVKSVLAPELSSSYNYVYEIIRQGLDILPSDIIVRLGDILNVILMLLRYKLIFVYPFAYKTRTGYNFIQYVLVPQLSYAPFSLKDKEFTIDTSIVSTFSTYAVTDKLKEIARSYSVVGYSYKANNFVLETVKNVFRFETKITKPTSVILSMQLQGNPILCAVPLSKLNQIIQNYNRFIEKNHDILNESNNNSYLVSSTFYLTDTLIEKLIPRNVMFFNKEKQLADPIYFQLWSITNTYNTTYGIVMYQWMAWSYLRMLYDFYREWSFFDFQLSLPYTPLILAGLPSFIYTSNIGSIAGIVASVIHRYDVNTGFSTNVSYESSIASSLFTPILKLLDGEVVSFFEKEGKFLDFAFAPLDYDYLSKLQFILNRAYHLLDLESENQVSLIVLTEVGNNQTNPFLALKPALAINPSTEITLFSARKLLKNIVMQIASYSESVSVADTTIGFQSSLVDDEISKINKQISERINDKIDKEIDKRIKDLFKEEGSFIRSKYNVLQSIEKTTMF